MFFNGAISSGHFSSPVDLSPNYSGTLFGISNTLSGGFMGYTVPVIVGIITQENMTWTAWTIIFGGAAAVYIITNFFYFFMISGEIQSWNYYVSVVLKVEPFTKLNYIQEFFYSVNKTTYIKRHFYVFSQLKKIRKKKKRNLKKKKCNPF